jgi:hypothetical protein
LAAASGKNLEISTKARPLSIVHINTLARRTSTSQKKIQPTAARLQLSATDIFTEVEFAVLT